MSHGPLMSPPEMVRRTVPWESSTNRQPALAVAAVPSLVGKLPTITHPELSTDSAVVSPTPPGQLPGRCRALIRAKRSACPLALICMIVVPVPWEFDAALKLLTNTDPACSRLFLLIIRRPP